MAMMELNILSLLGNATPVIALTASLLEEEKAIVISASCDDFLRKPFTEHTTLEGLAKHLGVKYLYAKTTALNLDNSEASTLTSENWTCMSEGWTNQLYEAAFEANTNSVMEFLESIPKTESSSIQSLTKHARQFELEKLVDLAATLISNE
jgi:CheY-like chemotaxis protein